jgi:hypothetical protein
MPKGIKGFQKGNKFGKELREKIKNKFKIFKFTPLKDKPGYLVKTKSDTFYLDEEILEYQPIGHYTEKIFYDETWGEEREFIIDVPIGKLTEKQKKEQFNGIVQMIDNISKDILKVG